MTEHTYICTWRSHSVEISARNIHEAQKRAALVFNCAPHEVLVQLDIEDDDPIMELTELAEGLEDL